MSLSARVRCGSLQHMSSGHLLRNTHSSIIAAICLSPTSLLNIPLSFQGTMFSLACCYTYGGQGEWAFDFPRLAIEFISTPEILSNLHLLNFIILWSYCSSVAFLAFLPAHSLPTALFHFLHFHLLLFQSNVISVNTIWEEEQGSPVWVLIKGELQCRS